jgi:hypothetical protein
MTEFSDRFLAARDLSPAPGKRRWADRFRDLALARRANRDLAARVADLHFTDDRVLDDIGLTDADREALKAEMCRRRAA